MCASASRRWRCVPTSPSKARLLHSLSHTKDYFRFDPQLHLRYDGDQGRNADIRAERLTPEKIVALGKATNRG